MKVKMPSSNPVLGVKYALFSGSEEDKQLLENLFSKKNIVKAVLYGGAKHMNKESIDLKLNLWGNRAKDDNDIKKCITFSSQDNQDSFGYVNLGSSTLKINGQELFEAGTLTSENTSMSLYTGVLKDLLVYYPVHNEALMSVTWEG